MSLEQRINALVEEVRRAHAPDPRLSVFEIEVEHVGSRLTLRGAISEPVAVEMLHRRLGTIDTTLEVVDEVVRLPAGVDEKESHALVTAAIAPMLAGPMVAESHVSQALLGHRLLVLRQRGRWLHCRADDGYLGWVHRGYVRLIDETEARAWEIGAGGAACLSVGAEALSPDGETFARLPWGARVVLDGNGTALLPDGSTRPIAGELLPLVEQERRFPPTGAALVRTAARWMGAPYLWGGTTPAGVDCSGLAQAVFRTHGIDLPRDSDQQAATGTEVEPGPAFQNLRPGDLLFFAETPDRITHVTISTGGPGIIHSSLGNGGVRRNDLTGPLRFERDLRALFICARRLLSA
jgi:hypothetical protein